MRNLFLLILGCWSFISTAQYYSYPFKLQVSVGSASYYGDLCEGINCATWNYSISVNTRSVVSEHFSIYTHLGFSRLSSIDKIDELRNLSFRSDNIGFGIGAYYMFTKYRVKSEFQPKVNPYIGVGAGGLFFNPKAQYESEWYELQGLNTEGENYSRFAWQVPLHLGFRFRVTDWVAMGIEYNYYFVFTDYLDDVSNNYVDNQTLLGVAADLADRTFENENTPTVTTDGKHWKAGTKRGNDQKIDKYNTIMFYLEIDLRRTNVVMFHK